MTLGAEIVPASHGSKSRSGKKTLSKQSTTDLIDRLLRIRADMVEKLKQTDALIEEIRNFENKVATLSGDAQSELSFTIGSPTQRRRGHVSPEQIADEVYELIREKGRPMKRGEIARALLERNIPLAGKDRNKNVGTILWRHQDRFVNIPKLGYWIADTDLPGVFSSHKIG
ncbi:hypothetical protein [Tardiphaga sp.]|uniref:hypothetical protein n=1 Tax=Tardiphaga sp. TaxID=1926292 RepID=UPI0037D9C206